MSVKRNPKDYPIHFSEFDRETEKTDTTIMPSRTMLTFIPSIEEMTKLGYTSETFTMHAMENADYGDFSGTYDYEDILMSAAETREKYDVLPEHIKSMFKTPDELLRFVEDPANHKKAEALGILKFNSPTDNQSPRQPDVKVAADPANSSS